MLKEREQGFDVAPRASSAKPAEYDAFKDPNMQQYFSQPQGEEELAKSGLIKSIQSPVDGEDPMWVPNNTPKKIFYEKDPVGLAGEIVASPPLSVLVKRKEGEEPEMVDKSHSIHQLNLPPASSKHKSQGAKLHRQAQQQRAHILVVALSRTLVHRWFCPCRSI